MQIQKISFAATLLLLCVFSNAQPVKPAPKPALPKADSAKGKLKLVPSYGAYTNGSSPFVADIKRFLSVNPPLKLKDEKGMEYTVVSFEIIWKKKEASTDFRTGKPVTVYTYAGGSINGNQLTDSWREEISNSIQKGEELNFGTILYFDPKRKVNSKAPSLVLSIR